MTTRTITIYRGQGQVASQVVEWPDGSPDEEQAMQALGYTLMRNPIVFRPPEPDKPNKSFAIYGRDSSTPPRTPTYPASWIDGFRYAVFTYVNNAPQGDPIFIPNIGGVEAYTRSQLDSAWDTSMEWPHNGTLQELLNLRALVLVEEPSKEPWYGVIQSIGFGHFNQQGVWQPTFVDVWHADVKSTSMPNGVRREAAPRTNEPTTRVSYQYIRLPGMHDPQ